MLGLNFNWRYYSILIKPLNAIAPGKKLPGALMAKTVGFEPMDMELYLGDVMNIWLKAKNWYGEVSYGGFTYIRLVKIML